MNFWENVNASEGKEHAHIITFERRGGCITASSSQFGVKNTITLRQTLRIENCDGIESLGRRNTANSLRRHWNHNMSSKFFPQFFIWVVLWRSQLDFVNKIKAKRISFQI